jgi:hypothetical protein
MLDYVENTLGSERQAHIKAHFQSCSACAQLLQSYIKTTSLCRSMVGKLPPENSVERLLRALRNRVRRS